MKHILIIGGTGMLKEASLHFAKENKVSVIARQNSAKLKSLAKSSGNINTIEVDYSKYDALVEKISQAVKSYGPITVAIVWIHDYTEKANEHIAKMLGKQCKYFHIFGYSGLSKPISSQLSNSVDYRKIVLGQIGNEWLTDHEISKGVIEAVEQDKKTVLVGDQ